MRFLRASLPGYLDIGGYVLAYVAHYAYDNDRLLQVFWGGTKWHVTPRFFLTASYYRYKQDSFATGKNSGCTSTISDGCSGRENAVGVLGDCRRTRRFDAYLGTLCSEVEDGLAGGFLNRSTFTTTLGLRFAF
jgi:hypothetical protein